MTTAAEIVVALALRPHPEGGWYGETYRSPGEADERPAVSAIHYLLESGQVSAWHRIDATEVWLYHAGAPLKLSLAAADDAPPQTHRLGPDVLAGERPQIAVPTGWWQSAASSGDWTLVSCVVAPAFNFDGFEMAEAGWAPGAST
jgi:predicted cupin superfamily sugar epimerase